MDADASQALGEALAARYAAIHASAMRDMPVCNEALAVAPIGFRPFGDSAAGIVITPWFMNLTIVGALAHDIEGGACRRISLPLGDADFVAVALEGFGPLLFCSLFSPMFDFPDMATACMAAREAMAALFDPHPPAEPPKPSRGFDRRALLFGQREAGS